MILTARGREVGGAYGTIDQERPPSRSAGKGGGRHRPAQGRAWWLVLGGLGAVVLPIAIVGGLFLWPVASGAQRYPAGFDTTKYIYRANAVAADGIDALDEIAPPRCVSGRIPNGRGIR